MSTERSLKSELCSLWCTFESNMSVSQRRPVKSPWWQQDDILISSHPATQTPTQTSPRAGSCWSPVFKCPRLKEIMPSFCSHSQQSNINYSSFWIQIWDNKLQSNMNYDFQFQFYIWIIHLTKYDIFQGRSRMPAGDSHELAAVNLWSLLLKQLFCCKCVSAYLSV